MEFFEIAVLNSCRISLYEIINNSDSTVSTALDLNTSSYKKKTPQVLDPVRSYTLPFTTYACRSEHNPSILILFPQQHTLRFSRTGRDLLYLCWLFCCLYREQARRNYLGDW